MFFNVLNRYISKTIFINIIVTLFLLISLSGIIKFIDQLKKTGQGKYDAFSAGIYTILSMPRDLQIFFPMAALLGTLMGLGILTQNSELIIMEASGFTRMQLMLLVIKIISILMLFTIAIGEWLVPQSEQLAYNYRAQAIYGSLFSTKNSLWTKDGNNFIHVEHIKNNNELDGISIYTFNDQQRLQLVRYAVAARFDKSNQLWRLSQACEVNLTNPKQIINSQKISSVWKTSLTPDKLDVVTLNPNMFSINRLYNYINYLRASGQDPSRYQLNMWKKIFQPISLAIMMLIAISFIFSSLHNISVSVQMLTGITLSFFFYILEHIFSSLMLISGVNPIFGALLPCLFFLISLWLLINHPII